MKQACKIILGLALIAAGVTIIVPEGLAVQISVSSGFGGVEIRN